MKVCVVGCGMQGSVATWDLSKAGHKVLVLDNNPANLKKIKTYNTSRGVNPANIKTKKFNVKKSAEFIRFLKNFDIVVGALPSALGFYNMECAVTAGVDIVDMSYSSENPFLLDKVAKKKKVRIVPDAGFAPGLSNILIGEAYSEFKGIDNLRILVGGIPQNPLPPLNYRITWSATDLIEAYTRPARIIKKKKLVIVDALSGIEQFKVPKIGKLECFYTDGLRTLLTSMKNVKNMEEKTIRYSGHARIFKTLLEWGFLSDKSISIGKKTLSPKDFTLEFLKYVLTQGDEKDLCIMIIEIEKGKKKRKYMCVDYYDEKNKITSMARMTAYTGSVITQCIKKYPHFGLVPPEYLGMHKSLCRYIKNSLKKYNIIIKKR
jgi:lysine 6-dehydrogenase